MKQFVRAPAVGSVLGLTSFPSTRPLAPVVGGLTVADGFLHLVLALDQLADGQTTSLWLGAIGLAQFVAGTLLVWRPSFRSSLCIGAVTGLLLAVSAVLHVVGSSIVPPAQSQGAASTEVISTLTELGVLLALGSPICWAYLARRRRLQTVLAYRARRRRLPTFPMVPLTLVRSVPMRRATVVVLTAFAATALGPVPATMLNLIAGASSPYRTEPASAQSGGFLETWDGAPGNPQVFTSPRWILMPSAGDGLVDHNPGGANESMSWDSIEAGHGPHCEPPIGNPSPSLNNHLLPPSPQRGTNSPADFQNYVANIAPQAFYICNNHMMSVMKSGTAASSFMPRYALDWSGGRTQTIQFEVNPYSFQREWWELYIAPRDELTIDTHILSKRAITFAMLADVPQVKQVDNYRPLLWSDGKYFGAKFDGYCTIIPDPACNDPKIRRTVKITFNQTSFTMSVATPTGQDYSFSDKWVRPLTFTTGVAMMSHWAYNPTKDGVFGTPWSQFTYHWDNFAFDGPATPLMTGYLPERKWIDTNTGDTGLDASGYVSLGKNPSDPIHVNITSSDLRNPVLWGMLTDGGLNAPLSWPSSPARSDQKDTLHWAQVSVNSGPWLDLPSVRDANSPFITQDNGTDNQITSHTFKTVLPPGSIHQGDNTLQFRAQAPSDGFTVDYVEIQVDPNRDLPPANPTGASLLSGTPTVTPTATTALPTATATSTTAPATPTPTRTPVAAAATPTRTPIVGAGSTSTVASATPTRTPVPAAPTATRTPVPPTATATRTPVPVATATRTPAPAVATATRTPVPPTASPTRTAVPTATSNPSGGPSSRVSWQGTNWYLHGANLPWINWSCDFGCGANGGASSAGSQATLNSAFSQLSATGAHTVRWWVFPGDPWQINRDSSGVPTSVNSAIYADFDAALRVAEANDLYFDFVLFAAPSQIPSTWMTDPVHRSRLAAALSPLFARYRDNPRVMSWEVFNEPEWDIWNGAVAQGPVQSTVRAIRDAVHANSNAYVTVGSAMLDGLPLWVGLGLDYYQAHWYGYMSSGDWCAPCTDYATVRARYNLDAPLVIGETYAGSDVDAIGLLNDFYSSGYAGAWPWSLLPNNTSDHMAIDMTDLTTFAGQHADTGPRRPSLSAATATPTTPATATRTATPVVTATRTATPVPPTATRTAVPGPPTAAVVVRFNDLADVNRTMYGEYPSGLIDWGADQWYLSEPWERLTTNSISFNGEGPTSAAFNFLSLRRLNSVRAYNGGDGATNVTLACNGQNVKKVRLAAGQLATIETGWTTSCRTVRITSTNGWWTNFDDLVVG